MIDSVGKYAYFKKIPAFLVRIIRLHIILIIPFITSLPTRSDDSIPQSHPIHIENPDSARDIIGKIKALHTADTYSAHNDTNRNWWHLLKKGYFNPKDTTVEYSKFMRLFNAVYNWGDRIFNTYDTTYVDGFGKNWKARLAFDAWTDTYHMNYEKKMPMTFISAPYSSIGAYLHFMAVSVNYQIDMGKVFFGKPINHKKFEFGFNCARFNAELSFSQNTGGTYIRRFGDLGKKRFIRVFFPGVKMNNLNFSIYYFLNNFKYANGAAYNFSRIQKKSAGSFILGFNYAYQDSRFDFSRLPDNLFPYLTWGRTKVRFHYNDYCLLMGYGYNCVLNKYFLYNISILPSIGIARCYEDSFDGGTTLLALNPMAKMSFTYNMKDLFCCLILKGSGQWYNSKSVSYFSGIANLQFSVGVRF